MKKILLSSFTIIFFLVNSFSQQVVFSVESPSIIAGDYDFTISSDAQVAATWNSPDMSDTANAVMDTLMFVEDGTPGLNAQGNPISQEGCDSLINDLTGKIAVIYRNTCQFGTKSLNAQNAGAVAVIIINREPGTLLMNGGDDGLNVNIPVVFIDNISGTTIVNEMANGPVVAFIGTRYFANNLTINSSDIIRPRAASTPASFAQDNTEYDVQIGSWVVNAGTDSTNAILNAKITFGGTTLYDVPSAPTPLLPGDSAYFALPTFSQASYSPGMYNITYSVDTTGDEFIADNEISQDFHISPTKFSNVPLDSNENMVLTPYYRPSGATGSVTMCAAFQDPNASRMAAMGMSFAAVVDGGDLTNRYFSISASEWNDVFTDLDDPAADILQLNTVSVGEFTFPNDSAYQEVYVPFVPPVALFDNQRYLFCVNTFDTDVYIGFDNSIDYNQNVNEVYKQPIYAVENNGNWSINSFGTDVTAGVSVELTTNLNVQEDELFSIDAYPNPANNVVTIPLKGYLGKGSLNIMDVTGKIISTSTVNVNNLMTVDVTNISNGNYIFDLNLEDGRSTKFNIVISK